MHLSKLVFLFKHSKLLRIDKVHINNSLYQNIKQKPGITMFKTNKPHRNLINPMLVVTISISLFSCQNEKGSIPEEFVSYHLEKEKEFLIHSLASVELLDYSTEDGLYLGYSVTPKGDEITLVNEDGEIVLSRNMQGEGPEEHVSNLSCLAFS